MSTTDTMAMRPLLFPDAQADAGLARAVTAAALGLVIWLILGAVLVRWHDRKGYNRLDPELLGYVASSLQRHRSQNAHARQQDAGNAGRQADQAKRPVLLAAVSVMSMAGIRRTAPPAEAWPGSVFDPMETQ
jgi:hypothetical protein